MALNLFFVYYYFFKHTEGRREYRLRTRMPPSQALKNSATRCERGKPTIARHNIYIYIRIYICLYVYVRYTVCYEYAITILSCVYHDSLPCYDSIMLSCFTATSLQLLYLYIVSAKLLDCHANMLLLHGYGHVVIHC